MMKLRTIRDLPVGEAGFVKGMTASGSMRRRLLDIGVIWGTRIERMGSSPAGDPSAYRIRGAVIAIRNEDAEKIFIE